MRLDAFFKVATTLKEEGEEAARDLARQLNVPDEQFDAHRAGMERARILRPLPIAFGRQRHGPFTVEGDWLAAMHGGAEWDRVRASYGAQRR